MIGMLFAQPTLNYPLKCGACQTAFNETYVERIIIDQNYYENYVACVLPLYWSQECLEDCEELVQCPFCSYLEIHTTDTCSIQFLTCQHPNCGAYNTNVNKQLLTNRDYHHNKSSVCTRHSTRKTIEDYQIAIDGPFDIDSNLKANHKYNTNDKIEYLNNNIYRDDNR
ncbi:unnamed protein product [Rotaria sp. Silwood1]|nr:unnamed protein product [Rotaria sp. Silwood1]CAF1254249.1 unnamed protein product [Rotaria sp. Silwood1]